MLVAGFKLTGLEQYLCFMHVRLCEPESKKKEKRKKKKEKRKEKKKKIDAREEEKKYMMVLLTFIGQFYANIKF